MSTTADDVFGPAPWAEEGEEGKPQQTNGEDQAPPGLIGFRQAEDMEPPPYAIHHLIPEGGVGILGGDSGDMKTALAMRMAVAIATGDEFWGLRTNPGTVLFLASEGMGGIRKRMKAVARSMELDLDTPVYADVQGIDLLSEDSVTAFIDRTRAVEFDRLRLLVIDTLSASMPGGDENSPSDSTGAMAQVHRIRQDLGVAILLVHHFGKDRSRGLRGHSSLYANADFVLQTRRIDGDEPKCPTEERAFEVVVAKSKDDEAGRSWSYGARIVEVGTDWLGETETSITVEPREAPEGTESGPKLSEWGRRVEQAFRRVGGLSGWHPIAPEIQQASGYTQDRADRNLEPGAPVGVETIDVLNHLASQLDQPRDQIRRSLTRGIENLEKHGLIYSFQGWLWAP